MIKLDREPRTEERIPRNLRGDGRVDGERRLLEWKRAALGGSSAKITSRWGPAKRTLRGDTRRNCAFCEADTTVVAYGAVEHFRPKARYWWLAYCYDNFVYSCTVCNTKKGTKFPVAGASMIPWEIEADWTDNQIHAMAGGLAPDPLETTSGSYTLDDLHDEMWAETALLIDPYLEEPSDYVTWELDEAAQAVRMISAGGGLADDVMAELDRVLGINREELLLLRFEVWEDLDLEVRTLRALAAADIAPDLRTELATQIKAAIRRGGSFSAMAKYFVEDVWAVAADELNDP